MPPVPVLLDANAFAVPFRSSVHLDAELGRLLGAYELLLAEATRAEVEGLVRARRLPRGALALLGRCRVVATKARGDEALLEAAAAESAVLFTNDRALRQRARARGISTLYLRGVGHLELQGRTPHG